MYAFKITGGTSLKGMIEVKGAKNAVLPMMAAALLTDEPVTLTNISYLSDVKIQSQLLESLGVKITHNEDSITLQADTITNFRADYEFVSKMRASFWVLGPLVGRFGEAAVSLPGGCAIGARPSDIYFAALESMGAMVDIENGYVIAKGPLHGADVSFRRISVGATHNTIMAAVLTPGVTTIYNAAREPEVVDLINLLNKMGAKIEGAGTNKITVTGVEKLHGATHSVVTDRIETASFAIAAALTKGNIFIKGGRQDLIEPIANILQMCDVNLTQTSEGLWVDGQNAVLRPTTITTSEYPGFPTDVQSPMTTLLALADGTSYIEERIYENRFMHVPELNRMGSRILVLPNDTIRIHGVNKLSGATVMSSDLRGGMALVLAALVAKGETIVKRIYHIERGYYKLEERLAALGAKIERVHLEN
ncbi:MAG: UDP-N-acetylglucosamine 1-carboxyvinyltransferase [Alphaproteobacteria bacterium]|nr:UDP-N-acetylglucosamine 1-carboxyvinyltransferase [Alphaproteobacteria bacterium]